jgi:23S rRNA (guanosine2251-2'-O)-methyltransferase
MSNKLVIFGLHAIETLLNNHPERIIHLYIQDERHDQKAQSIIQLAKAQQVKIEPASRQMLDRLTSRAVHQGVAAYCQKGKEYSEQDLAKILADLSQPPLLLVLDGIQDPHNLGACLRSAEAAGVHAVIVPRDKSVGITATVSKVACGAAETIPFVQVTNLARTLRYLKDEGIWLAGAAGEADKTLFQADLTLPLAIILGAEEKGLRRLTREHCDMLLSIPMQGAVSSLNVSVATGVFLFEALRQRQ